VLIPPYSEYKVSISKYRNYVCEPFNQGTSNVSGINGLKASLAFVSTENSDQEKFAASLESRDYWDNASPLIHKSSTSLFFSQINTIPTKFDQGFSIGDGKFLANLNGDKLIEWFGVRYETEIGLSSSDPEGYYKLATVSDDGVRIDQLVNNQWVEVLNNDGIHSPRFQCQEKEKELYLTKDQKIKIRIYFYQGPRVIISNVLMFKYLGTSSKASETVSGCELSGSESVYSDPWNGTVVGLENYTQLMNAGWKIIPSTNFFLSNGEVNPCTVNNLTLVDSIEYKIEGDKVVGNNSLTLKLLTSLVSESIVKLFDDSGSSPRLIETVTTMSSRLDSGHFAHNVKLTKLAQGKSYRIEVVYRNADLNISNRAEYLIKPVLP
jgi:hypothetical protein